MARSRRNTKKRVVKKAVKIPQRRSYLDWTVISLTSKEEQSFVPIGDVLQLADQEARCIGLKLGPRHPGCIMGELNRLKRHGLLVIEDNADDELASIVRLTERGRAIWKALSAITIDDCKYSTRRKKAATQTARLKLFKSTEKLAKRQTTNQLEREIRVHEKRIIELEAQVADVQIGPSISGPCPVTRAASVVTSSHLSFYASAPASPSHEVASIRAQTPPSTPIRNLRAYGSLTSAAYPSPDPESENSDAEMDVDEPYIPKSIFESNVTPSIPRSGSLNNPHAYPTPVSAQRLRYVNAEAGSSDDGAQTPQSLSKGVQASDDSPGLLHNVWNGVKRRIFGDADADADTPTLAEALEKKIDQLGEDLRSKDTKISDLEASNGQRRKEVEMLTAKVAALTEELEQRNAAGDLERIEFQNMKAKTDSLTQLVMSFQALCAGNPYLAAMNTET